jgi:hypothetical protein
LLGTLTGSLGLVAWLTSNDPSFAIERDYYQKAVDYDRTREQADENSRLGWHVELNAARAGESIELAARVKDTHGREVRGATIQVEGFAIARSSRVVVAHFMPEPERPQTARLPLVATGLWELRFTVQAGGKRFTETLRRDIGSDGS